MEKPDQAEAENITVAHPRAQAGRLPQQLPQGGSSSDLQKMDRIWHVMSSEKAAIVCVMLEVLHRGSGLNNVLFSPVESYV